MFIGVNIALAPTPHRVEYEGRGIESSRTTSNFLFEIERGPQGSPQLFNPANHIVHEDIVRMRIDVTESPHQELHRVDIVVNPPLQYGLIANSNAAFHQPIETLAANIGNLTWMIEVRM